MRKFNIIFYILFISVVAFGAGIGENILRFGDKTGSDVEIQMGAGRLKWDDTNSKMQFSHDGGSLFQDIGSGGNGAAGVSLLENSDFEGGSPPTNWTESAGTFIAETTNPGFDLKSGSWDASATSQTLDSDFVAIPEGLENRSCNATIQFKYASGTSGDYKFQIVANIAGLLAEKDLALTTDWAKDALQFTCPAATDTFKIRIISTTDASIILLDNASLGKTDFVDISQTILVAHAFYLPTTSCLWASTSVTYADFATVAACPSITVISSTIAVDTSDNDLPDIDFDFLPAGSYVVIAEFTGQNLTTNDTAFRISDGTNAESEAFLNMAAGEVTPVSLHANFVYSTGGPRNFKIQTKVAGDTSRILNSVDGTTLKWQVIKYPTASAEAITIETIGEHWDVNIGGANPSLGTAGVTSYTEIINAGLDLVINSGSKSAQIPCSTTNPSTGVTCAAGSEGVGIVIDISTAGRYRACMQFSHIVDISASATLESVFQWVETPNNAQTILQEGKGKQSSQIGSGAIGGAIVKTSPLYLCGEFNFSSAGQHTLRLMFEQDTTGAVNAVNILGDRSANNGQRDIHITVDKLDQQMPTPAFTDLTTSLNAALKSADSDGAPRLYSSLVISVSAGVPSILGDSAENITSISDDGVGTIGVVFNNDYTVQNSIKCFCIVGSLGSNFGKCNINHPSITTAEYVIETRRGDDGLLFDNNNGRIQTFCIGK